MKVRIDTNANQREKYIFKSFFKTNQYKLFLLHFAQAINEPIKHFFFFWEDDDGGKARTGGRKFEKRTMVEKI